jgi:hypothetical protein
MRYMPVLFCALALLVVATQRSHGEGAPEGRYELVSHNMGPFLYRLDRTTGEVCAVKAYNMNFAYLSMIPPCAGAAVQQGK